MGAFASSFEKAFVPAAKSSSDATLEMLKEKIKQNEESRQSGMIIDTLEAKIVENALKSGKSPEEATALSKAFDGVRKAKLSASETMAMAKVIQPELFATGKSSVGGRILMAGQGGVKQIGNYGPGDKVFKEALTPEQLSERTTATEEAKYGGPKEIAARAFSLRNEFQALPTIKDFQVVRNQVNAMDSLVKNIKAGDGESALALDQGLITMFNKITDPQSVVRESEYERTAQNLSLANRFQGAFEKLQKGGAGLTTDDREALVFGAKVIADSRGGQYNEVISNFESMANEFGVKPELVTGGYGKFEPFIKSGSKKIDPESLKKMSREEKIAMLKAKKK